MGDFKHTGQSRFFSKKLKCTRWCAHYEAVWAIKMDIQVFYKLSNIFLKTQKRSLNVHEVQRNLCYKLVKLEYAMLMLFGKKCWSISTNK